MSSATFLNSILLSIAPLIWGMGFAATRITFDDYGPLWSHGIRYAIAGLIISIPYFLNFKKINSYKAFQASILLTLGLILQTIGVKYTSLAKSGFFTTFYVILTPLMMSFFYKTKFSRGFWFCVSLAVFGVGLMCDLEINNFNFGDLMIIFSALFFAAHILFIGTVDKSQSAFLFNSAQCLYTGLLSVPIAFIFEGVPNLNVINPISEIFSLKVLTAFIVLSVFSSIIAFSIQVYAQKKIPAHIASMIFLLESIFASFFGYMMFNENLSLMNFIGIFFILVSVAILSILKSPQR